MFGIAGTAELSTFCPGTGTWNRLQDGTLSYRANVQQTGPAYEREKGVLQAMNTRSPDSCTRLC